MKQINENPKIKSDSDQLEELKNDLESACQKGKKPLWLVLLDNLPTLVLIILGALLIFQISLIGAIGYVIYSLLSIVRFWAKICPSCHHYNTYACPCGYGVISAKLFKKREDRSFKKVFKQNIGIVFPNWFVPFIIAIYLLVTQYTQEVLILTITFSMIGFVVIPLISKFVGCKNCEIKEDCPWMQKK
ncbi:MAG: hypothetical protein MUP98_01280 [Candidatus Aminicenantes bacterium]|nr:hypothetical protein [Candidatus Aminicenantes bacterium]